MLRFETKKLTADLNLYLFTENKPTILIDPFGLWTYSAWCRYLSGGELFGGGVLKCQIKGPCMKNNVIGKKNNVREVGFTETIFVGVTAGSPGGVTWFEMTLNDNQYSGEPSVERALGWSAIFTASRALEQLGSSYTELRLGSMYYRGTGHQSGIDFSIDYMGGYTSWNNDVWDNHYWECCYEGKSK